jgi:FixJ family two-component response regulator
LSGIRDFTGAKYHVSGRGAAIAPSEDCPPSPHVLLQARNRPPGAKPHKRPENRRTMDNEPTVFIVDDDPAIRHAMEYLMRSVDMKYEIYRSADEFLGGWNEARGGCLVLDIRMPGMGGLELQDRLRERDISLPIIFITGHADVPMAVDAMQKGAFDFIQKPFRDQDLLERIGAAIKADRVQRAEHERKGEVSNRISKLTPREREVMDLVVTGKANKIVAYELGVSQRTVEIHRARVMEKMGARSLADLVRMTLESQ